MSELKIDGSRLRRSLMELARIGATEKGGVRRLALSDLDRQGRELTREWFDEAGLKITVDRIGNIFARRAGADPSLPPVVSGSHIDTQPSGGKFDGNYGVMAALEVVRTLNDTGTRTLAPFEIAIWTNEEGSRFVPVMMGSGVFAGAFSLEHAMTQRDADGVSVGEALRAIGYAGDEFVGGRSFAAYYEAHIEQGPILEDLGHTVGVVTGALGLRWYDLVLSGQDSHAGPTPMRLRRDALLGAARIVDRVNQIALTRQPGARATVGFMQVLPNSRNVVPGTVRMSVDLRHPTEAGLDDMEAALRTLVQAVGEECAVEADLNRVTSYAPVRFDASCIEAVRQASERLGYSHSDIVSGAGHDACYVARVAPTGMIFVPCEGGISHNEIENAKPEDLEAGCNVLLHAVLASAGTVD
ncbi:MAG: Zn-dependent hydrolase [Burkholderiales bacterium]|nr:Zn-dependent hydrolase [Burkholderiales bacterium]